MGNYILCIIENQDMVHHGINKEGRPSAYTVDSFSQNASIVGEYSVEKDYFTDYSETDGIRYYKKIHKDIEHAINHSGDNLQKIYLITSQEEIPSFRKEFNKTKDFQDNKDPAKECFSYLCKWLLIRFIKNNCVSRVGGWCKHPSAL